MKVLIVHNSYKQSGGEDVAVAQEAALLRLAGHEVREYRRSNHEVDALSLWGRLTCPKRVIWAGDAVRDLRSLLQQAPPHLVHFHNNFMMISPAAYYVCQEMGIPVVQTLHNYRLFCPRADFFRNGHVCEDCLGKRVPWPGIVYGCYHDSRAETAVVATMLTIHRWLRTWHEQVDIYIALTEFARQKFLQAGLAPEKLVVKPNFVYPDPGMREGAGDYAIFVGRFSPEKNILMLLQAWRTLGGIRLKLVGDGPEVDQMHQMIRKCRLDSVELLGWRPREEVFTLIKNARFLIFSSELYESFPMTIAEAFACGTPVIASRLGVMAEIVEEDSTGLFYTPGSPEDLADRVRWAVAHPSAMWRMGENARRVYEEKYTPEKNYEMLLDIYQRVAKVPHIYLREQ